ncbi:hypothetical protein J5J10_15235 [Ciceribacter sp. L1K23]|nr:hypothetical protein [Ciceribacter sp. L1K23]
MPSHRRTCTALAIAALALVGGMTVEPQPAHAVVYCKAVGVPKGCVARPAPVVYCTRPGYPVGCVGRPAGAAVYCTRPGYPVGCVPGPAGTPANRGGPVNRLGIR